MVQTAIFPMDIMNITQDEYGDYSHQGVLAMDFVGTSEKYPYYAPCDMELIGRYNDWAGMAWKTVDPVLCADGVTRHFMLRAIHDCEPQYSVGDVILQGEYMGQTGICGNVTGDHVHFDIFDSDIYTTDPSKALHLYDVFVVPLSVDMVNDRGHDWVRTDDDIPGPGPDPTPPEYSDFFSQRRHSTNMRRLGVRGRR